MKYNRIILVQKFENPTYMSLFLALLILLDCFLFDQFYLRSYNWVKLKFNALHIAVNCSYCHTYEYCIYIKSLSNDIHCVTTYTFSFGHKDPHSCRAYFQPKLKGQFSLVTYLIDFKTLLLNCTPNRKTVVIMLPASCLPKRASLRT